MINAEDFILNNTPYSKCEFNKNEYQDVINILFYYGKLDCFCPSCGLMSVFNGQSSNDRKQKEININLGYDSRVAQDHQQKIPDGIYELEFACSRIISHKLYVFILVDGYKFSKVGMSPSMFEIKSDEGLVYKKILGEQFIDLKGALMMISNGFGVAAFTHLRRIIENYFLKCAYKTAQTAQDWDESFYKKQRFGDKLKTLKSYLPKSLIENSVIYSILSKGIHELTEKECCDYFEVVKTCIYLCLDDVLAEEKRKESKQRVKNELAKINNAIK